MLGPIYDTQYLLYTTLGKRDIIRASSREGRHEEIDAEMAEESIGLSPDMSRRVSNLGKIGVQTQITTPT